MLGIQINFKWNVNLKDWHYSIWELLPLCKENAFIQSYITSSIPLLVSIVRHGTQNGCYDGNKTGINADN